MPRGPIDPDDVLEYCHRGCGTQVKHRDQGKPHTATELVDGQVTYYTCSD